jgi:AraC-like DNA-binding protein
MADAQNLSLLAIGRDRLFYSGLAGNSKQPRSLGGYTIYFSTMGPFEISLEDGVWQQVETALVCPFQRHRLMAPAGIINNICLEPESLSPEAQTRLQQISKSTRHLARLCKRADRLQTQIEQPEHMDLPSTGFSNAEFDRFFFGESFAPSKMDRRISRVMDAMCADMIDTPASAEDYADMVALSPSRFLYLFKLNTGAPFRAVRMWKRARRFLDHANGSNSLTDVALDLGYPDSSHFSHSIRRIYGLKPRSIRQGSKDLRVLTGANYTLAPESLAI